jgi:LysR family transcriptional regulator for bpeEF and oprC
MSLTAALRDLNQLNTFVRVAERRSFTKAAADLRTTPSVVSKHVKELEESLGFTLLNRSTHGVVLTEAGEGLFQNCLQMLDRIDEYVIDTRNLQTGPYGTLRVQTIGDYARAVMAPLVVAFIRRSPGLRIHLTAETGSAVAYDEGFDVVVASRKPPLPGFTEREIGTIRHVICASPDYFRRCGRPTDPRLLKEHNCVGDISAAKEWPFRIGAQQLLVLAEAATEGLGIVRIPRLAVESALESGKLEALFEDITLSPERLSLYFSKSKTMPAKTVNFIEFVASALASDRDQPPRGRVAAPAAAKRKRARRLPAP